MTDAAKLFSDGEAYERLMGRWSRVVGRTFLDWLDIPPRQQWLDVGCGNGAFTELLISRCAPSAVSAIDPSEGQLAYARTRLGAQMAQFRQADAQTLPFDDNSFDTAAMALVISFVPDPAKAVAEMARVVRPGGWVATYMWKFPDGVPVTPIYVALKSLGIEPPLPANATVAEREALQALWERAGLSAVETREIAISVEFADFNDFWASNSLPSGPQGVMISKMSADKKDELRERLRAQLPVRADGRIVYDAMANAVKGRVPQ